jgi:hypothetical protein
VQRLALLIIVACWSVSLAAAQQATSARENFVNDRLERSTTVIFYFLWDWFDGGLFEGW